MAIETTDTIFQHFSGTGADSVLFGGPTFPRRKVNKVILTTTSATMSLNGTDFMPVADGTHQFDLPLGTLHFGAGTWAGVGVCI